MDSPAADVAGTTPPAEAPVSFPMFAAVAAGMTGKSVYEVLELVGGLFEAAGAVFEGSPDAPATLIALLPPSDRAAMHAVQLGLQAQATAPALRLGIDATEVHSKQEQDARWQQVIDSAVRLEKAARSGEVIAGDTMEHLTDGGAATEALRVGDETYLLLTGVRDLSAVPDPVSAPPQAVAAPPSITPVLFEEPVVVTTEPQPAIAREIVPVAPEPSPATAPDPVAVAEPTPAPADEVFAPFSEPVPAHVPEPAPTVAAEPSATPAPALQPTARWDGPLVGRDGQLDDLRTRFERATTERRASCLVVAGESGVGKTRLVAELARSVDDVRHRTIACAPADLGGARWPLADLVEALTGLDALAPPADVRDRLAELFDGHADADRILPELCAILALDGAPDPDLLRWVLRRLVEVSVETATLVQIDDADRVGAGFVRLLSDVTTAARDAPLLIVLTSTGDVDGVPTMRVAPLGPDDAAMLVGKLLGAAEPGVAAGVAARAGGNPFAIEQALALLTETGTLAPGQGRWMPLADLAQVPMPDTPIALIRQRLQTLPAQELAVIGMAAVAGERFAAEPLLDVLPPEARAGAPAHLADLVARGYLLIETPTTFRFRHPLLAQATLAGVPDWAQATAHERVARDLERVAGERLWRHAGAVGDHLEASCRLRPDTAPDVRNDALEMLAWSASAAVEHDDLDGAARLERRAAALLDHDPVRRAELLYLAAEHGSGAAPGRPADREIAEAALASSVAGDDVDWRVRLLRARLRTTAGHEDALEGARATADEAIAAFAEDDLGWALSKAWALRGLVHMGRAQNGMVADDLMKAADNAAAAERWREETSALRGAAAALLDGPVPVEEAEARCISFLPRVRGSLAEHDIRGALALLRARRSAFDTARSDIIASIAALEELGAYGDLAVALYRAAQIEILTGQPAAGEPQMQRALAAAAHARDDALRAALAASFAHILIRDEERLDEALALADVAEAHARDITTQVGWRMARARVMVRRGRGALAERLVREALSLAEQTDSTALRATALLDAADVRRRAGRPSEAEPFEKRALRLFERRGATAQAAAIAGPAVVETLPEEQAATPAPETTATDEIPIGEPSDVAASDETRVPDEPMLGPPAAEEPTLEPEPPAAEAPSPSESPVIEPGPWSEPWSAPAPDPTTPSPADVDDHTAEDESKRRWFNR